MGVCKLGLQAPLEMILVGAAIRMQQSDAATNQKDGCADAAEEQEFAAAFEADVATEEGVEMRGGGR